MRIIAGALFSAVLAFGSTALAAAPLEDYGKLPQVQDIEISPRGDQVAILASQGEEGRLIIRTIAGGPPMVVNTGTNKVHDIFWIGPNHVAIRISETVTNNPLFANDQFEMYQTTVYSVVTHKSMIVFRAAARKVFPATFSYLGYSSENGHEYGYFNGQALGGTGSALTDFQRSTGGLMDGDESHIDLFRVDLDTEETTTVSGGSARTDNDWVMSPNGQIAAETSYRQDNGEWKLFAHSAAGPVIDQATSATHDIDVDGLGRTQSSVIVVRPGAGGDWSYLEYSLDGSGKGTPLFQENGVVSLIRDPVTRVLLGSVSNHDHPTVTLFDPTLQAKFDKARRPFAGERVTLVSWSANMDKLVLLTESDQDSGTYFLVDVPGHTAAAVGWRYPTIMQADVAPTSVVDYTAGDGMALHGILTLPPGKAAKGLALIVLPHGGPVGHDSLGFDWWAQALASRGYAVFQPNFRGSDGYGKAFEDAGHGQWGRKMQTDISDGVTFLAKQGVIDPSRACIVGWSYGGYAALAGVTLQHGLYRCAVAGAPVADLADMMAWHNRVEGSVNNEVTRYFYQYIGVKSGGDPILNTLSPRRLAGRADAPILLIHGNDDTTVPIEQSRDMAGALRGAGKPVELIELPGEDHHLTKASARTKMLAATIAFVEKYNPPN